MPAILALLFIFLVSAAFAGGRGGHLQKFDPNLFGGGWTTITCDGTSNDNTNWAAWRASAVAANPAVAKLYVVPNQPPCNVTGGSTNSGLIAGITNPIIWGYGAAVTTAFISQLSFYNDHMHSSRINAVTAGDITVTVNDGTISLYSVGNWIAVTGFENQTIGFPPSHLYLDYRLITAINSNTITLNAPVSNSLKSTWPLITGGSVDLGGPATIYLMQSAWNSNVQIYGLTVNAGGGAVGAGARTMSLYDMVFQDWVSPTQSDNFWMFGVTTQLIEMDKEINFIGLNQSNIGQINCQTGCANILLVDNSRLGIFPSRFSFNGTSIDTTVRNTVVSRGSQFDAGLRVGSGVAVGSKTLSLDSSLVTQASASIVEAPITLFGFSSGVLSIANNDANYFVAVAWGAPNHTYYFSCDNCAVGVSPTTFQISDVSQDMTNTYYTMSNCSWGACTGALPNPMCQGSPCTHFMAFQQATITQKNSPAGSVNLTTGYTP